MTRTEGLKRRRRADGERTRQAILDAAARLATVEGIEGLSFGRLALETGMSKSGLFAHFGSKEELQLATIDLAEEIFRADVLEPALTQPDGLPRLLALCDRFLSHVEREVFPGGCFFASTAAELDTRPGPLRDRVAAAFRPWGKLVAGSFLMGQEKGEINPRLDPEQMVFEILAMLAQANALFLLRGDRRAFELARRAIRTRLDVPA